MIRTEKRDRITALSMSLFLLITHIYRWTNTMYNHDSLMVYAEDTFWQYSLGRFLNPVYLWARGRIAAPMVIGIFGSIYLIIAAILLVRMFDLKRPVHIVLFCGLMATHETLAYMNASFLLVFDIYMFSFLCSVVAVWAALFMNFRGHYILSVIAVIISLGLYQNFVEVFVFCVLVILFRRLINGEETGKLWADGWKCAAAVIIGGGIYYVLQYLVLQHYHISPAQSYNGLHRFLNFGSTSILKQLAKTWIYGFRYLYDPAIFHALISRVLHACVFLYALFAFLQVLRNRKLNPKEWYLMTFLLLMMPFGINLVYFLSNGLKYGVMRYPFVLFYGLLFVILDIAGETEIVHSAVRKYIQPAVNVFFSLLIVNHFIFANQFYVKKHLEYETTYSLVTRMISRMEETEGFVVGETPIAVIGYIDDSPLARNRFRNSETKDSYDSKGHPFSFSYSSSVKTYFKYVMNYPNEIIGDKKLQEIETLPEVLEMAIFPAPGSVKMIQDVMIVRLSEDLRTEEERYNYGSYTAP